ncbi:MAG: Gfo/Idh/MocA family oxidoreductase [Paludibacter sp.]|nr:Gfo/Idh/MocA family oxidoreductase [Paludibacter sp.]
MKKIGLIGAGFMGGTHAACYEILIKEMDIEVVAVADISAEKAEKIAEKFKAKVYTTGEELIYNAGIDVADICLPTYLHANHAEIAMKKGFDVFIEKPVCMNGTEAQKLLEVQQETETKVAVGHCIRFWDAYDYLKKLVDNRTYGKICNATFKRVSPKPDWAWENWLFDEFKSGGAALDLHIHDVDFVRYLLGKPRNIQSKISGCNNSKDHIHSIFEYDNSVVSIEGGWDFPTGFPFEMSYNVVLENACITFSSQKNPSVIIYMNDGSNLQPVLGEAIEENANQSGGNISGLGGYYNELKYFYNCLLENKPIEIAPLKEAVESLKLTLKEIETGK